MAKRQHSKSRNKLLIGIMLLIVLAPLVIYLARTAPQALADSLLTFNEGSGTTINDSSGSASGTITGATWKTSELCRRENCLYFDGSDWISFGDEASYDFAAATDFTIQFWFRHGPATAAEVIIQKYEATGGDGGYRIQMESDGDISFGVDDANGGFADDTVTSTAATYDDNRWHHVAAVKDGTTGIYLYIDNALVASDTSIASTGTLVNDDTFYIGDSNATDDADEYIGFLDEVKIYTTTARTAPEVSADYLGSTADRGTAISFGPDNSWMSDGLVGYWSMEDNAESEGDTVTDLSGNGNTGTLYGDNGVGDNGTGMTATASGKFGTAAEFDGTDDYVNLGTPASLNNIATGKGLTVSAWYKFGSLDWNGDEIVNKRDFDTSTGWGFGFPSNYYMTADIGGSTSDALTVASTRNTEIDTWHYVTMTYNDTGDRKIRIFLDGTELQYTTQNAAEGPLKNDSSVNVAIGAYTNGAFIKYMNGNLDEVRIYNRALSPAEVSDLYNWAPGPISYWPMDENSGTGDVLDISGNNYHLTMEASMTQANWVPGKFGSALYFDGTDDDLDENDLSMPNQVITGDVTLSAWIKRDRTGTTETILFRDGDGGGEPDNANYIWQFRSTDEIRLEWQYASETYETVNASVDSTIPANTWAHIAAVRNTTDKTVIFYENGVQLGTAVTYTFQPTGGEGTLGDTSIASNQGGNPYKGIIDEVKIYNYTRTQAQIIEDMNGGHPLGGSPVGSQVAWWKLDEQYGTTANDTIGNSNGTIAGANWLTNSACKINGCLNFDAAAEAVTIATASDSYVDFNTSEPFSASAWVYPVANPADTTDEDAIIAKWDETSNLRAYRLFLENDDADTTGNFRVEIMDESTAGNEIISAVSANDSVSQENWYHVAFTFNGGTAGAAGDLTLYVNGVKVNTNSVNASFLGLEDLGSDFTVGEYDATDVVAAHTPFTGRIDEVKIYNAALTAEQVLIDMNAGSSSSMGGVVGASESASLIDGPGDPPVAYWDFNENTGTGTDAVKDKSGNGNDGTMEASMTNSDWVPGKFGSTLDFDGSDDYVNIGDQAEIDFDLNNFTLETWFKTTSTGTHFIINKAAATFANGYDLYITNGTIYARAFQYSSPDHSQRTSLSSYNDGEWHHVSAVYDRSKTNIDIYLDGVLDLGTKVNDLNSTSTLLNAEPLQIGRRETGTAYPFLGSIDEVKIYNYARTPAQVAYDYNRGAPMGWWKFDECTGSTVYDSSGNGLNGTITIGASGTNTSVGSSCSGASSEMWTNGATGVRNSSLDFDNTDDYATVTSDILDMSATQSFSIALWAKREDLGSQAYLLRDDVTSDLDGDGGFGLRYGSDNILHFGVTSSDTYPTDSIIGDSAITDSAWHHIAAILDRSADRMYLYVDGILQNDIEPGGVGAGDLNNDDLLYIGAGNTSDYLGGQIDDLRFYSYPLTAAQVKNIMNTGAVYFGP